MEISFGPDVEAKLNQIASQAGKDPSQIVKDLVANHLEYEEWFKQEVSKGLASLNCGKSIAHEEVRRQMERVLKA